MGGVHKLGVPGGVGHSPIVDVYGIAKNEKKDAPYKMGRKLGRKAEATK